jgi:uncharacterized protein (DUF362 family)
MQTKINRREMMACGMGAAAMAAGLCPKRAAAAQAAARAKDAPTSPVSILRCESFEPQLLRRKFDELLDLIGGIDAMVRGKTVTVKINLTGMQWKDFAGMPAYETYQTHPNTLAALCAVLDDAGAKRIVVVENLYWDRPVEASMIDAGWDVKAIESAGGHKVTWEDTRNRGGWPSYSRFNVPWGGFVYPAFDLNQRFEKADVLVSLSKLKQHACAGVTMTAKNFFGITPCSLYGNDAPSENPLSHRTNMFHAGRTSVPDGVPAEIEHDVPADARFRVPRIVADIYGARPADLALVDGIRSISGGEGFWNRGVKAVEPKLLLAGKNGITTDAVSTAAMGFDPMAPHGQFPFPGDNHLTLLAEGGIGTNDLQRIEVVGLPLNEAVYPYQPQRTAAG